MRSKTGRCEGDKYAEILLQQSAKPHQSLAVFGGNGDTLQTQPNQYAQRRAAQTGISWDKSECQAARNCRWGCYRLRFQRDPALSRREDRQIPARQNRESTRGTVVMDVLRVVRCRPLFRAIRAFPKLRARKDLLCHQSLRV